MAFTVVIGVVGAMLALEGGQAAARIRFRAWAPSVPA